MPEAVGTDQHRDVRPSGLPPERTSGLSEPVTLSHNFRTESR